MYNKYYTFGSVTLELTGEKVWKLSDLCRPFRAEPRPADHTIHVTVGDDMPQPPEGAAHEATLYRWREGERFCLLQDYGSRYRAFAARQGGLTEVRLSEGYRETASDRVILESAGLFDLLADFGMLILHSAYIVTPQGQGLLFSGPSGAGKSTQAELWRQYAGAQVINGDRSLVRPGDGTVHGILYSGTSGICQNVSAPLRGHRAAGAGGGEPGVSPAAQGGVHGAGEPVRLLSLGGGFRGADDGAGGGADRRRAGVRPDVPER